MKNLILILTICLSAASFAQTGSISGTVLDKEVNLYPFAEVTVQLKGTDKGAVTDFDGLYTISNITPGTYTVIFSFVGYTTQEIEAVVTADTETVIDLEMTSNSAEIETLVIKATTSREKEQAILSAQKNAVEIKQEIGAQEMSRKGAGDAAAAVAKTSGVSKQEGSSNVFVRGLGDRYNYTALNGLPLPSNNPFYKNIDLGIFSTDIIKSVSIDKVMNIQKAGEFAGANIDISTKEYTGKGFFEVSLGTAFNAAAVGADNFRLQDGPNLSGFTAQQKPNNPLNGYNFDTSWNTEGASPAGMDIAVRGGKRLKVGEEGKLGVFASASFTSGYSYVDGSFKSSVSQQGFANKAFDYESFSYKTNTTGIFSANYKINKNHSINYNFLFINDTDQNHRESVGREVDVAEFNANIRRSNFDRTTLIVQQLTGKSKLSDRLTLTYGGAFNQVKNDTPDRMKNYLQPEDAEDPSNPNLIFNNDAEATNHRFFQDLLEIEYAGNVQASYDFGAVTDEYDTVSYKGKVFGGYSGRYKKIDFDAIQFNLKINNNQVVDPNNLDAFFNQQGFQNGDFSIRTFRGGIQSPNALDPQVYEGEQAINAGFIGAQYQFTDKLFIKGGLRAESIVQTLDYNTQINSGEADFDTLEFLPSLIAKYELTEKQNLRLGLSRTYTLPQFRERAPFQIEDANENVEFGNPNLSISTDYNADFKWEYFPGGNEVYAATLFGKYITDPINKLVVASSTNDFSYVNTGAFATAVGLEVEVKKDIFENERESGGDTLKEKLSAGVNASFIYTNQEFDADKIVEETDLNARFTNEDGQLTGASPFLANADVTYLKEFSKNRNIQGTLTVNYFSDRLYAIGTNFVGNQFEKGVTTLDLIVKGQLTDNLSVGLSAKNLLNPAIERYQEDTAIGDIDVLSYRRGSNFKVSLTYKF